MRKSQRNLKPKVLFNASVVLSGIYSPNGGSSKVLSYIKDEKIDGYITEIIEDEILKHSEKINTSKTDLQKQCHNLFTIIFPAPKTDTVNKYNSIVLDEGDRHVLASAEELKVDILVTLDKKHLLVLKNKIKNLKIFTPGELIEYLMVK